LLAPHIDHLFDQGDISFTDFGDLLVSPKCPARVLVAWGISPTMNVGPFRLAQRPYLAHHRGYVLKK
jgi:putative restriction endonuclease